MTLPEGWEDAPLFKYLELVPSGIKPFSGMKKYIDTGSIETGRIRDSVEVDYASRPSRANMEVFEGDILFAKMKDTEKVYRVAKDDVKNIYSTGFAIVRVKDANRLLPAYVFFFLRTKEFQDQKNKECTGATQKAINETKLKDFRILVPPIKTQAKVVALLGKAEEINAMRKHANLLSDEYLKGQLNELLGENQSRWKVQDLRPSIRFITSGSRGWAQYYCSDGPLFIRIQNVSGGMLDLSDVQHINPPQDKEAQRTKVEDGDLLISITADLGRTAVIDRDIAQKGAHISQHLALVRLDRTILDPTFVAWYLESEYGKAQFRKLDQSAVKSGLNFESIRSLTLPIPPLSTQKEFARMVHDYSRLSAIQKSARDLCSSLFEGIMHKCFQGHQTHEQRQEKKEGP